MRVFSFKMEGFVVMLSIKEQMLATMQNIRQAEAAMHQLYNIGGDKTVREGFTSEEWNVFVDCLQEVLQLEYSLVKLKNKVSEHYRIEYKKRQDR